MPIKVTCPKCQGVLHAPDDAGGKRGKCPTCGTVLAIPAVESAAADDLPFAADPPPRPAARPAVGTASAPALGATSAIEADARRSSFGSLADAPPAGPTRLPPSFGGGSNEPPKKSADPFARKAPKPADPAPATDSEARNYRRLRRGLGSVGFGYTLVFLGVVAAVVVPLLPQFGVSLPNKTPGYLGQPGLSTRDEFQIATLVPVLLGALFVLLGRSGAGNAPRASGARGTFKLASLFTLLAVAGAVAYLVPTVLAAVNGLPPAQLIEVNDGEPSAHAQRGGIAFAVVFGVLAEVAFWFGLGRLGSGLGDARATGRVTRYALYASVVAAVLGLTVFALQFYPADVKRLVETHVFPLRAKLGEYQKYLPQAYVLLAAAAAWLIASRAIAADRRAVRLWLERHA